MLIGECIWVLYAVQKLSYSLSMSDGAIFVTHEESTEVPDFLVQLSNLSVKAVVFGGIHFDFSLKVS